MQDHTERDLSQALSLTYQYCPPNHSVHQYAAGSNAAGCLTTIGYTTQRCTSNSSVLPAALAPLAGENVNIFENEPPAPFAAITGIKLFGYLEKILVVPLMATKRHRNQNTGLDFENNSWLKNSTVCTMTCKL